MTWIAFTVVSRAGYSAYEYDFVGGVFAGSKFQVTSVERSASYSSYEVDYDHAGHFTGDKVFFTDLPGQTYTVIEEEFDAASKLSRVLLTGVSG